MPGPQACRVFESIFMRRVGDAVYVIGAFWCNPVDSIGAFNKTGGLKQGFFGKDLKPRPGLTETRAGVKPAHCQ